MYSALLPDKIITALLACFATERYKPFAESTLQSTEKIKNKTTLKSSGK